MCASVRPPVNIWTMRVVQMSVRPPVNEHAVKQPTSYSAMHLSRPVIRLLVCFLSDLSTSDERQSPCNKPPCLLLVALAWDLRRT